MKKTFLLLFLLSSISHFSQETEIIEINNEKKGNNKEIIPFAIIDEVPVYKGCESFTTNKDKKNCMNTKMRNHIVKHFNTELVNCLETKLVYNSETNKEVEECINVLTPGIKRIYIQFKIAKTGEIKDINVRAPHPKLKEEGIRITKLIPAMIPGKQKGSRVSVGYTLPISFKVK